MKQFVTTWNKCILIILLLLLLVKPPNCYMWQPEKFQYLKVRSGCREKPYVDNFIVFRCAELLNNPGKECRYPNCPALALREKINDLPVCVNQTTIRYMKDLLYHFLENPGTKVSYNIRGIWTISNNHKPYSTSSVVRTSIM